jgi:hypothetical protein
MRWLFDVLSQPLSSELPFRPAGERLRGKRRRRNRRRLFPIYVRTAKCESPNVNVARSPDVEWKPGGDGLRAKAIWIWRS